MTTITPELIKELRDRTSISIGKCKEALTATRGNLEEAIDYLRKQGVASAIKKESRAANEGIICAERVGDSVAFVEGSAETDFVVKNEKFQRFLQATAKDAATHRVTSLEQLLQLPCSLDPSLTIDQYRAMLVQVIGENIQLRRCLVWQREPNTSMGIYSHQGGKIITALLLKGSEQEEELARELAMHGAAAAPDYIAPDQVPPEVLAHEKEIVVAQIQGKPAAIVEKIVEGKLKAFCDSTCLLCQKYIKDDSVTVREFLEKRAKEVGKPLSIEKFLRWNAGVLH